MVAHNGNLYDFPLLKAELVKTGVELGLNIFCVDSYVGIKEIYKNNMGNLLVGDAKPSDIEDPEERKLWRRKCKLSKYF